MRNNSDAAPHLTRPSCVPKILAAHSDRQCHPSSSGLATGLWRLCWVLLFLAWLPGISWAQTGRAFVSVEAYVGLSRIVHVGKIVELQRIEYKKPLTDIQKSGKPYRVVFEVRETIRGEAVKRLELVLALQSTFFLEYLREQAVELLLTGGPMHFRVDPDEEVGIEEQGQRMDDERYQLRLLEPLKVPECGSGMEVAQQINKAYESGRMFTHEFEVIEGREAILKRARAFAKGHTKILSAGWLHVPRELGAQCGDPNAFCIIILPACPETRKTLIALHDDPDLILRRIKSKDEAYNRSLLLTETDKALAMFPQGEGK